MRFTTLMAALFFALPGLAASPKPNPADYTVKLRVVASRVAFQNGLYNQVLYAYVDGQYEVLTAGGGFPLKPGDYPAKLSQEDKHPNGYDVGQQYTLLFPDGSTRSYLVTGIGLLPAANPQ